MCLDTWMFPVYDEVFDQVKKPLVFINSWVFQWPYNIRRMLRLVNQADNKGKVFI